MAFPLAFCLIDGAIIPLWCIFTTSFSAPHLGLWIPEGFFNNSRLWSDPKKTGITIVETQIYRSLGALLGWFFTCLFWMFFPAHC